VHSQPDCYRICWILWLWQKGRHPKRKRKNPIPIESQSVRQCLQSPSTDSASTGSTAVSLSPCFDNDSYSSSNNECSCFPALFFLFHHPYLFSAPNRIPHSCSYTATSCSCSPSCCCYLSSTSCNMHCSTYVCVVHQGQHSYLQAYFLLCQVPISQVGK